MNVVDYQHSTEYTKYIGNGIINGIFKLQDELIDTYVEIESKLSPNPIHRHIDPLNTADALNIKALTQRVIEELCEAEMARAEFNDEHVKEEVIDAICFATELMILLDIGPESFDESKIFDIHFEKISMKSVVTYFGRATNTLKNKPWKKEAVLVDETTFRNRIITAFEKLLIFAHQEFHNRGIQLFKYFYAKWATNAFRQNSNY